MNEQKNINDEWELNNLTFIGKQLLTIFSFEENNIDNSIAFIKEQLVSKKPKFKINNSSLLFTSFFLNNIPNKTLYVQRRTRF